MKEINIIKIIKEKNLSSLKNVVLVYGNEEFLKSQLVQLIKSKFNEVHTFWGDETNILDLKKIFYGSSLFSKENVVIIRNTEEFFKNLKKEEIKDFLNLILKLSDKDKLFVILSGDKIPTKEPYKTLKGLAEIIYSQKLTPRGFLSSLKKKLERENLKISNQDLTYLAKLLGNDLYLAKYEVEKLILYCKEKGEISKKDIDTIIYPKVEENIFSFINLFFKRDKNSLKVYRNLINANIHPFEIQSLILNYTNKLLLIKDFLDKGLPINISLQKAGVKFPFQQKQFNGFLNLLSKDDLINLIKDLYNLEIEQKVFFENPTISLERFILKWIID